MEKAILRTLVYADVFDYPLKEDEIWQWLIKKNSKSLRALKKLIKKGTCQTKNDFYFLKGRQELISLRRKRERWSQKKMKIARRVAHFLCLIPWIKLIGVTGALAMENSQKGDDIDFLIITSKDRTWLSRGLIVSFLRFFGLYRRPGKVKDRICPNMIIDEKHLTVPKKERDLFSAHEVCQMKPLWQRGRTYRRYLRANQWSKEFLPNWKP